MIDREWWTKQLPLEDNRDVLARVGFRFLWTTVPICIIAYPFLKNPAFAVMRFLAVFSFLIPIAGGLVDWFRIRRRLQH
jgi:hypothetical protein